MTGEIGIQTAGDVRNYVSNEWRLPSGVDGTDIDNPATGETIGHLSFSTQEDIDDAVNEGQEAFKTWSNIAVTERVRPLYRLKHLLEDHLDELAEIIVRDHGKTIREARGELRRGIENIEVACGIPSLMQASSLLHAATDIDERAIREPIGVVAAITPFNFPGMIPLWFLPYAVGTGNCFILKPSERVPLVTQRMFELIEEAGFPDGVIQLVNGAAETVNIILNHDGIEGISFVGSTPVAKHVYETAAASGKRVQAQGGAKNYVIVGESADLQFAAEKTVSSSFACAGERCLANDVAVVHEAVIDEFTELVLEISQNQLVGNGLNEETDIGAIITSDHKNQIQDYIEGAVDEGAELLLDGRHIDIENHDKGSFIGPTIFTNVTNDMTIANEEVFGPVLSLITASDMNDAIQMLNGTDYGNAASLFTMDGREAKQFKHNAEVGNLGINVGTAAPMAFFNFGGKKDSFFGDLHAQGKDVIEFYTDKSIIIERWPESDSA